MDILNPAVAEALSMTGEQLVDLFRTNMAAVREELGISQSELARRIGRTPGYVCDIERGRRAPNLTTLAVIADGLGVTPAVLVSTALQRKK
jgi:transcriptional regulator with XRE-family HTH domain